MILDQLGKAAVDFVVLQAFELVEDDVHVIERYEYVCMRQYVHIPARISLSVSKHMVRITDTQFPKRVGNGPPEQ